MPLQSGKFVTPNGIELKINMDESMVPDYTLPESLISNDGSPIRSAEAWRQKRRSEILELFGAHVFGRRPAIPDPITFQVIESNTQALQGVATRTQVRIFLLGQADGPWMDMLIYSPDNRQRPTPLFVGLNFWGNHSIHPDPEIILSTSWLPDNPDHGIRDHRATPQARGLSASRWPLELILKRGYGLATIYYGDLVPDDPDLFNNEVTAYFPGEKQAETFSSAISVWAWGLSRALDYLKQDQDIDADRIGLIGHSRLGKSALWAGAQDERFGLVISNASGCGGAALSRRRFGETVEIINTTFPHWFCPDFKKYNGNEDALPLDQHMLLALIAPRPLYVASAADDLWADPHGEFLGVKAADPVYRLLGTSGMATEEMPPVNQPVFSRVGYHIRSGAHDLTQYDWEQYLNFADKYLTNSHSSESDNENKNHELGVKHQENSNS